MADQPAGTVTVCPYVVVSGYPKGATTRWPSKTLYVLITASPSSLGLDRTGDRSEPAWVPTAPTRPRLPAARSTVRRVGSSASTPAARSSVLRGHPRLSVTMGPSPHPR